MPRLLKDLTINDVSSVDSGAGVGVRVLLMKRDDTQEAPMTMTELTLEAVAKVADADVRKKLDGVLEILHRDGESLQQTEARVTDWRNPRYNKAAHQLFIRDVGKAAAANGMYGHGEVKTNGKDFDANSDEGERIARDGIKGGPEGDDRLQEIADAPKALRLLIKDYMNKTGLAEPQATAELARTSAEYTRLYRLERYGRIGV